MARGLMCLVISGCLALAACAAQPGETSNLSEGSSQTAAPAPAATSSSTPPAVSSRTAGTPSASRASSPARAVETASVSRAPVTTTVPEGTTLEVQLQSALGSDSSRAGDAFAATVTKDVMVDGRRAIPSGSTVRGIVKAVTAAKRGGGSASLSLVFNSLELPDESSAPIVASFSDQTASRKKKDAAIIGGSAAGGALLGRLIGKDTKGAVVGALAGGAAGTGVVMSKDGDQVKMPAGTVLSLRLEQSVRLTRT
jgi:hypothetical protein